MITTEAGAPGRSSSGPSVRPSFGRTPIVLKNVPETPAAASLAGSPTPSRIVGQAEDETAAALASVRPSRARSAISRYESSMMPAVTAGFDPQATMICPGAVTGTRRNSTAWVALVISVAAPIASASVTIAVAGKPARTSELTHGRAKVVEKHRPSGCHDSPLRTAAAALEWRRRQHAPDAA